MLSNTENFVLSEYCRSQPPAWEYLAKISPIVGLIRSRTHYGSSGV
jgi:hypothetical protein